ncbi:DNA-protecting protein DprA [Actinomyces sp. zg-332]|uniref:DNA-processing protein DprA n=1 Tax=Actinomyces sp. zg-332 TaxID=2708340 RepID=UPI001421F77E|nr:DNA-processing protein DprA [Actinomyces sp. zg-332]QPK94682.1 DNA-protecting protein DprA [Actinomyces sp. zg-332]
MYSEKDLLWISLSICNSYSTLPLTQALIKNCGIEDTLKMIKEYDSTSLLLPNSVYDSSYSKRFNNTYLHRSFGYLKEILSVKSVEQILNQCEKLKVKVITSESDFWPRQLEFLELEKPLALWCRGDNLELLPKNNMISVVGSRKCSIYGRNTAIDFSYDLAEKNFTIVSGGAYGIDIYSHIGALNSTGNTISVLAGGVDRLYPSSNISVFNSILENGLIISENPIGVRPAKWKFLERNRIIAALSKVVLVVEAPEKSGSLNTASYAVEYGKNLGVIPGNIDSSFCAGSNALLKQGAYPITCVNDVLELMGEKYVQEELFEHAENENTVAQKRILSSLYKTKSKTLEELFLECELDVKQMLKTLSFLETKGKCLRKNNGWVLL